MQLRNLIIASGMTQIHVARSLGMNPSWFNRVCNGHGHLRASQVAELATVLRLPVADVAQALSKGTRNGTEAESERSDDRGSVATDN